MKKTKQESVDYDLPERLWEAKFANRIEIAPASDDDVRDALAYDKFPTTEFERISDNVVIADGAVVLIAKLTPHHYAVAQWYDYPFTEYMWNDIDSKKYVNIKTMRDIIKAYEIVKQRNS